MTKLTLKGNAINSIGELPKVGSKAPDFQMVKMDLSEVSLYSIKAKYKVLNIFPSVDTGTCATSVRTFNKNISDFPNAVVLNLSMDLPFALKRFCGAEGITRAESASVFRSNFSKTYGLEFADGPLKGLCSRAVIVLNENNEVLYSEQVGEISSEPNYTAALKVLK